MSSFIPSQALLGLLLACTLAGCQAVAGIEKFHPPEVQDARLPGSAGAGGMAGTAGTLAPVLSACDKYCGTVMSKCTLEESVYTDAPSCGAVCKLLEPGAPDDASGNTLSCRNNAALGISESSVDCAVAGPGGSSNGESGCGNICESYCTLMSKACAAEEYQGYWLRDVDACKKACAGLPDRTKDADNSPDEIPYSADNDDSLDHNGDTVQCRMFHAAASALSPANHCWHAALSPHARDEKGLSYPCASAKNQTAPNCEDYCRLIAVACTGDTQIYVDDKQCQAACKAFPPGSIQDGRPNGTPAANTLGCRYTHTYNALVSSGPTQAMHCGHSGPAGDDVCGKPCESYCQQLHDTCGDQAGELADQTRCLSACGALDYAKPYSLKLAKSGRSPLACRFNALVEARANPADLKARCAAALGQGCN